MIAAYLYQVVLAISIPALGILLGLLYKGVDRVLAARMQARVGPPVTQPFRDVRKLMMKESIVPASAVRWLFNLMPVIALASSMLILLYLPVFGLAPVLEGHGDMLLILYMLLFPSLAIVIGGFASGSPYATVGAQREMVTMISYEFPLAIAVISVAWLMAVAGTGMAVFSLSTITSVPVWSLVGPLGAAGLLVLFFVMLLVMPGELGTIPFDVAEAETELAGGVLVEYSGRNLALFYLADAVKMIVMASVIIALFLPWGISGAMGLQGISSAAADAMFFMVKVFGVVFFGSTFIRIAVARPRINQVVKAYWGYATLAAFIGLLLIGLDIYLGAAI